MNCSRIRRQMNAARQFGDNETFARSHERSKDKATNHENAELMVYKSRPTQEGAPF